MLAPSQSRKGTRVLRILSAIFKIGAISLITGAALSALDISAADILADLGLTPQDILGYLERGAVWAVPNLVLGLLVVVPIWFVIYLLRPPRG